MASSIFEINPENLKPYLVNRGLLRPEDSVSVRELGGGVSNIVLLVEGSGLNKSNQRWVVKQSLDKLRVEDDWRSERERIFREAEAIQSLRDVLGHRSLPEIIDIDRRNYVYVMTAAPQGSKVWKELLLAGQVDLEIGRKAGELLAMLMSAAHNHPNLRTQFEDRTVFDQLRIDPYYRTTAARHPELKAAYQQLIADSWGIRTALVHGDYSPKNMLVKDGNIFLIDFEVVHWGDPAFDSGFLLNHLFLKALHQPGFAELYFQAARRFWRALVAGIESHRHSDLERMTLRHLGGLMLARIDGKSPVEYIRDEETKERVRRLAQNILLDPPESLDEAISLAVSRIQTSGVF
jgi:5-methylthioribose kinase